MALDVVEAISQLQDRSSAKRRSAAKRLRRLGDPSAGPALLEALKNEVRDSRTWETQYQMTMALGTCGSPSDLSYLRDLVLQRETLHAVHTAGGRRHRPAELHGALPHRGDSLVPEYR
ncbi:HEAT repeat domain-containing protein [Streptomyces anulatus]|uniref:HEAT repeat domain-containing protein n=1 Tax=Streptomyces anulatus TaxID=1892 RepID=UPI0033D7F1BD